MTRPLTVVIAPDSFGGAMDSGGVADAIAATVATIDPSLVGDDREMLEDLLAAAFNDAAHKVESTIAEKVSGMTAGLGLPPGFKLPF